jgi:hypothetical protein
VKQYKKNNIGINPLLLDSLSNQTKAKKEIRPVFQFFALLNALEASYQFNRFQYTQTLISMHKEEYFAGKALKKDFTPNRKYSSIFG